MRTGSRRHRISTVFQILGRRADSLRIGHYTNFLDTTDKTHSVKRVDPLYNLPVYVFTDKRFMDLLDD